jgi:hypothetical protein
MAGFLDFVHHPVIEGEAETDPVLEMSFLVIWNSGQWRESRNADFEGELNILYALYTFKNDGLFESNSCCTCM